MKKFTKTIVLTLVGLTLTGSLFAEQRPIREPEPIQRQPRHRSLPPPPPPRPPVIIIEPGRRLHSPYREISIEGRLKIKYRHGHDVAILETRYGDYILYPDEHCRHPLSFRDFEFYDHEFVVIEGYEDRDHEEIAVTDIRRSRR